MVPLTSVTACYPRMIIYSLIYVEALIISANSLQILVHFFSKATTNFTDMFLGGWFSS